MLDLKRMPPGFVIGQQRKRRDAARPVTCLAMLLKNSNDLIVEGHRRLSVKGRAKQEGHEENPSTPETHEGDYIKSEHKDTKAQRHKERPLQSYLCGPSLCLCAFVFTLSVLVKILKEPDVAGGEPGVF